MIRLRGALVVACGLIDGFLGTSIGLWTLERLVLHEPAPRWIHEQSRERAYLRRREVRRWFVS